MKTLSLGQRPLQIEEIHEVAYGYRKVSLSPSALKNVKISRKFLLNEIESGKTLYGVNTGFGILSNVKIEASEIERLQYNLLRSHAVGTGDYLDTPYVRAMMLLRAQALAQGYSGVSHHTIQILIDCLNKKIHPRIPVQGSVGASGDLAPLSHLALVLVGEGEAEYKGKVISGAEALKRAKLKPVVLGPKEGLALINGTQFMTAIGALLLLEAEYLVDTSDLIGALTVEAIRGTETAFEPEIHAVRPHPGQVLSARRIHQFLRTKNKKSQISLSHENCGKVQDPYSLRCMPQVHGASRDSLSFVRQVLEREINAVTDNPLVFAKQKKILSGGNFHGQIISVAMDLLSIALAEIASISEQRIEKLVNPTISDLPAFLTNKGGLNSGFMIVQVAAASIVSENKTLCHPASVDSIPTSADKEDHVSMGAWAARKASMVVTNCRRVLAMELLAASQGIEFLRPLKSTQAIEALLKNVRKCVSFMGEDRYIKPDIDACDLMLRNHQI